MKKQIDTGQKTGLDLMRVPFEKHHISLRPQPTKKDNAKGKCDVCGGWHGLPAIHLEYVGHAATTDRFLDADINWTWEPLAFDQEGLPRFDKSGGLWIKLTVCGVTRYGYGNAEESPYKEKGSREKEVIGDALRNAGMRFGAALDLWHKGDLHGESEPTESIKPKNKLEPAIDKAIKELPNPKTESKPLAMLSGMYMIQNGELKGKFLKDLSTDRIAKYLNDAEAYFDCQGGHPFGSFKDDMNAANNYLEDQAELLSLK